MGKKQATYRGFLDWQSEFDHYCACWANNHMGWAKAKKFNKRVAKRRKKQADNKALRMEGEDTYEEDFE